MYEDLYEELVEYVSSDNFSPAKAFEKLDTAVKTQQKKKKKLSCTSSRENRKFAFQMQRAPLQRGAAGSEPRPPDQRRRAHQGYRPDPEASGGWV